MACLPLTTGSSASSGLTTVSRAVARKWLEAQRSLDVEDSSHASEDVMAQLLARMWTEEVQGLRGLAVVPLERCFGDYVISLNVSCVSMCRVSQCVVFVNVFRVSQCVMCVNVSCVSMCRVSMCVMCVNVFRVSQCVMYVMRG